MRAILSRFFRRFQIPFPSITFTFRCGRGGNLKDAKKVDKSALHLYFFSASEGLELIDFETLLPAGWETPDWLPPAVKLEVPHEGIATSKSPNTEASLYLSVREHLRPFAEKINKNPFLFLLPIFISSLLAGVILPSLSIDLRITLIAEIAIYSPLIIAAIAPLNRMDMQRLHAKALKNPLYEVLWKKAEASSKIDLEFSSLSLFLRPGMSEKDISLATYCYSPIFGVRQICIYQGLSERMAMEALIFETANAFQHQRISEVNNKLFQGKLDREEYVRILDYVEWETLRLYHKIMDFGKEQLGWPKNKYTVINHYNFTKNWETTNLRFPLDKKNSHADSSRFYWDRLKEERQF